MRRRDFLLGSTAALGLAGCGRTAVPRPPSPVNITRAAAYSQDIYDTILKPNLVEFEPESASNTHPMLLHATLEAFRELGAAVAIAEGPGHRRSTLDLAAAGCFPPALALAAYRARSDLLVSMPKMKTHHWAGATPSMKNLFGIVPGGVYGWPKNVLHWAGIHQSIADLH